MLTYNEERNLPYALVSVCGWASEVFVVDSRSSDRTQDVARQYNCTFVEHTFVDYSDQRNWALESLPISSEWIFFLDADERLTPALKDEIDSVLHDQQLFDGFLVRFRFIWMGKWIRRGYHSTWLLRLFRYGKGRCENRSVNEHVIVEGALGRLQNDLIHEDRKGIAAWTIKHIEYARREAELMAHSTATDQIPGRFFGTPAERVRWLRLRIYNNLPPIARPVLFFTYRVILRGGLRDGPKAWIYHFLHAFWVPLLIDCFYLELKREISRENDVCRSGLLSSELLRPGS